jgi:uncharacterized protein (TIGR04222 family)
MNVLDLRGPQFLGLYAVLSGLGLTLIYMVARGLWTDSPRTPSPEGRRQLRDPYLLAYLRGGSLEVLQTVAFSLNKRKLLSSSGTSLAATKSRDALQAVRNHLELSVLSKCATTQTMAEVMRDRNLRRAAESYAEPLRESALVINADELKRRLPVWLTITGLLLALAVTKIVIALKHGHMNVAFLVVLTIFVLIWAYGILHRRRTPAGDQALADQQTLFGRLKGRVTRLAADGATDEAVLVAAAFGLDALPPDAYPFAASLRRQAHNSSTNTSSCGGSSCGGGCGGGCGGCGS